MEQTTAEGTTTTPQNDGRRPGEKLKDRLGKFIQGVDFNNPQGQAPNRPAQGNWTLPEGKPVNLITDEAIQGKEHIVRKNTAAEINADLAANPDAELNYEKRGTVDTTPYKPKMTFHKAEAGNGATAEATSGTPAENDELAAYDGQIRTTQQFLESLDKPEDEEQRRKREKKEKSRRIISAVSDGLAALSNLYFTNRLAPDMYDHKRGLSAATDARIEKARAEREKNDEAYFNLALKIDQLRGAKGEKAREIAAQQLAQALAKADEERKKRKEEREEELHTDKVREQTGKADKAGFDAEKSRVEAQYAPKVQEANIGLTKSRTNAANASAGASTALAEKYRSEMGGKPYAYDENGKIHMFGSWETAEKYAREHGTWTEYEVEETTDSVFGTTTKKKTKGYSENPKKKAGSTMPHVND